LAAPGPCFESRTVDSRVSPRSKSNCWKSNEWRIMKYSP
jgi:hypothetical protein